MQKNLFFSFLILSAFVNAQNLPSGIDPEFLSSLPLEMQKDLLSSLEDKDSLEEPVYRRSSTFIEKPNPDVSGRFGSNVFQSMQTTLMPINEPNFDGSYILDFGDIIELQLIGQESSLTKIPIKRDGSINIKDLGKLFIAGLSLDEATDLIKAKINQTFIGTEGFVSLVNVRDIQVILSGNVFNPGIYTLNGNSNIFHALTVSGGPSDDGSFRKIDLIRENEVVESIDLYDTFIFGKSSFDKRLRSGDTIFINPVSNVVTASGAFKRPGIYELLESENLSSLLLFTNGLSAFADKNNMSLQRIENGEIKPFKIDNLNELDSIEAKDADNFFIRSHPFRRVTINGAVLNPGTYLMNDGDTIEDVIIKSGGFMENAYPFGGVYENESTREINARANELLYEKFLENILEVSTQGEGSGEQISSLVNLFSELKNSSTSGRIVVNFEDKKSTSETPVRDGDLITIPEDIGQVFLYGELSSQGAADYEEGKDLEYYINKVGGLNKFADPESIYVYLPNGESYQYKKNRNLFQSQPDMISIYSGTIIYVPRKINDEYFNRLRAQAYASIFSSLGVSLASISVLKD